MYLKNAPVYFVRGNARRAVYHSVTADELTALGWTKEGEKAPVVQEEKQPIAVSEPEAAPEPEAEAEPEQALVDMTKNELIEYAANNGVVINPYSAKAEILAACLEHSNG